MFVSIVASTGSDDEIGLLIDISVVRVEVLSEVVVENSWLSVMLHSNLGESSYVFSWQLFSLVIHSSLRRKSWVIINSIKFSLTFIFLCFQ